MNDPLHHAEMALDKAYDIRNRDHWSGDRAADAAYHVQRAQVFAAIALAEAAQRQAAAIERRNDLLEEANAHMSESSKTLHSSVMDLLNTVFKAAMEEDTE
jgi:hypothetical protein